MQTKANATRCIIWVATKSNAILQLTFVDSCLARVEIKRKERTKYAKERKIMVTTVR